MPISQIIKENCKECGKLAVEKSRIQFGSSKLITLECGHVVTEDVIKSADYSSIVSSDGRKLMPFQIEGVKFLEQANGKALLADEQGLGKTVQVTAFTFLHKDEVLPLIVATKTALKLQTMWEVKRWTGLEKVQVINSSAEIALPGWDVYITTYDMLKEDKVWQFVKDNIKMLWLDECQAIKNHLSGRAKAVQKFSRSPKVEYIIPTSGSPIENNAGEYFTVLNLLKPRIFNEYNKFVRDWTDSYETNYGYKIGGLSQAQRFHKLTEEFIIRRTKKQVLPDLPEKTRTLHHVELNPKFNKAYAAAMRELEAIYYSDKPEIESMIAVMTKMRKLVGLSKVTECVEFVADHVTSTNRKIVTFLHHHSVATLLREKLKDWIDPLGFRTLEVNSSMDASKRDEIVRTFEQDDKCKVLIASTRASGEGLNLQFMSDAILLERDWNPKKEEQAEDRFHRFGQKNPVTITYMLASETIDEYFTELVEQKRAIVASALDKEDIAWESASLMKELAAVLMTKGAKKWSLH